jgi:1,4-alpha-glucan branching enzyme
VDPVEIVQLKELNGVWSVEGPKAWEGCYYKYEVSVYHHSTLCIEKCSVNDPYARGYAVCFSLPIIHLKWLSYVHLL